MQQSCFLMSLMLQLAWFPDVADLSFKSSLNILVWKWADSLQDDNFLPLPGVAVQLLWPLLLISIPLFRLGGFFVCRVETMWAAACHSFHQITQQQQQHICVQFERFLPKPEKLKEKRLEDHKRNFIQDTSGALDSQCCCSPTAAPQISLTVHKKSQNTCLEF